MSLLASIIDSSDDAIISKSLDGTITSWNRAAETMYGYKAEEILGKSIALLSHSERADEMRDILQRIKEGQRVDHYDTLRLRSDGSTIAISLTVSPIRDLGGNIIGASSIARDITQRKQGEEKFRHFLEHIDAEKKALDRVNDELRMEISQRQKTEEELQAKSRELERSNADLEHFAYIASHDLQEPLRMVASYLELLAKRYQGQLDEKADKFIGYAVDGAARMQKLIEGLLAYARVERQGKALGATDCEAVLQATLLNLQVTIEEKSARVSHDPLPTVLGDADQLTILFQNLIGNALKFCQNQPPCVHIGATMQDSEWVFAVRDNGIGIVPEHAGRIFMMFQRLHTRTQYAGLGIGLAIAKKIVERHGGRMWVEAQSGQGSTFFFTLRPWKA